MTDFINWATILTYGGAITIVSLITQYTKDLAFVKQIPTQIWSYFISLAVLLMAYSFTSGINADIVSQAVLNAFVVGIGSNGMYAAEQRFVDNGKH